MNLLYPPPPLQLIFSLQLRQPPLQLPSTTYGGRPPWLELMVKVEKGGVGGGESRRGGVARYAWPLLSLSPEGGEGGGEDSLKVATGCPNLVRFIPGNDLSPKHGRVGFGRLRLFAPRRGGREGKG